MLGLMILCGLLANAAGFGLLLWEIRSNRDRYKGWEGRKIPLSFWLDRKSTRLNSSHP